MTAQINFQLLKNHAILCQLSGTILAEFKADLAPVKQFFLFYYFARQA